MYLYSSGSIMNHKIPQILPIYIRVIFFFNFSCSLQVTYSSNTHPLFIICIRSFQTLGIYLLNDMCQKAFGDLSAFSLILPIRLVHGSPGIHSFAFHGFSYLWSTVVWKCQMENSKISNSSVLICSPLWVAWWNLVLSCSILPRKGVIPLSSVSTLYILSTY